MARISKGDLVHLIAIPSKHYRVKDFIPENKSCNEMAILIAPDGSTAFWNVAQLQPVAVTGGRK